jgi:hypothetical protein
MTEYDVVSPTRSRRNSGRRLKSLFGTGVVGVAILVMAGTALAATVTVTPDPEQVMAPGGSVTYTVTVACEDTAADCTLTSLSDSVLGDLNGVGTCTTGVTFNVDAPYTCEFTRNVTGVPGSTAVNTVTATGTDATDPTFTTPGRTGSASVSVTGLSAQTLGDQIRARVNAQIQAGFQQAGLPTVEQIQADVQAKLAAAGVSTTSGS